MKRLFTLFAGFVLFGFCSSPAMAKVMTMEKGTVVVAEDEVIEDDLYIAGEGVEIEGEVNGDVYAAGGTVTVTGQISGDLVIGGGEVRVSGTVGDDLWVGAGNVYLTGAIIGDGMNVGAGSVVIDEESTIGGSLLAGTGRLENDAPVGRNLMVGAGMLRLDAPVGGEMRVGGETIELGGKAQVAGDLTYMSEAELTLAEGASIAGETRRVESQYPTKAEKEKWEKEATKFAGAAHVGMNIFSYFGALVVGLVALWIAKKQALAVAEIIQKSFAASLGWGLLVVVLAIPAILMLMMTGVGLPLAMIVLVTLLVDFYLAKIWASMAVGQVMQKQFGWKKLQVGWVFVIGLTAYYVLRMIPVVGGLVRLVAFLAGVGGMVMYLKSVKK